MLAGRSPLFWIGIVLGFVGIAIIIVSWIPGPDPRTIGDGTTSEGYAIAAQLAPYYRIAGPILVIGSVAIIRRQRAKNVQGV